MADIAVALPDGSRRNVPAGTTALGLAESIGPRLAKDAVIAVVDGVERDLDWVLPDGAAVELVLPASDRGRYTIRHSTAHVLAQAVLDLFPGATFGIGPPIENGFYYDFELPDGATFTPEDLERVEARIREIIAERQPFLRSEIPQDEAAARFAAHKYKLEIIGGKAEDPTSGTEAGMVRIYDNPPSFCDVCRGPHVPHTGRLGHFKLQRVAGAYWRGDERNPMLQRIYGTAWESKQALAEHLHMLEEAIKRDHRRLAVELDLLSFPEELGGGLAVWHPKGAIVRKLMEDYSRSRHERGGYQFVYTPHLANGRLFEATGHLGFYADSMYPPMEMDNGTYYMKPMNCPMHLLVFKSRQRSYRELPVRFFELGNVYRYERAGTLHGLMRIRGFTQDDAHIFCTPEQAPDEIASLLDFVLSVLRAFGFDDFEANLSTRPAEKWVGTEEGWESATEALRAALERHGLAYALDEGGGAFYGPKIDVKVRDAIGRRWQLSTIQYDFNMAHRLGLEYVGADNARHEPIMLHRALFGSIERFFGVLVEHFAGAFPVWLAPVQARVLPVRDDHAAYASSVVERLLADGFRVDLVAADEPLGARIRKAKLEKLPYVLVVGDDDVAGGTLGVNPRGGEVERGVAVEDFVARLAAEAVRRRGSVTLERLWAGWRGDYVASVKPVDEARAEGSVFSRILASGLPDEETHVVHRGTTCVVLLNAFPYGSGHLLVMPYREVGELSLLTPEEHAELWQLATDAVAAVQAAYSPDGVNMGLNLGRGAGAGVPTHLHLHVLPRWSGDTNFMTTVAEVRVLPEALGTTWAKVRASWPGGASPARSGPPEGTTLPQ